MTVQMHKSTPTKTYRLHDVGQISRILRYTDWQLFLRSKLDFVTANKVGARCSFLEFKESLDKVTTRQISAYLKMPSIARERFFVITETIKAAEPIDVSYVNPDFINNLLGAKGKDTLNKVIGLIWEEADKENWPLAKIEARHTKDFEVNNWEYVLLTLYFNSDFEAADKYLLTLYDKVDILNDTLSDEARKILQELIFFDVETATIVPSS